MFFIWKYSQKIYRVDIGLVKLDGIRKTTESFTNAITLGPLKGEFFLTCFVYRHFNSKLIE